MKKFTIIMIVLLSGNLLFGQMTKIDTSFYSQALGEEKMVDILFPPGYSTNENVYYPVIYYLHAWGGDQDGVNQMMAITGGLINIGTIDEVILVGADNSPEPFDGNMYVNSVIWGNYEDYMINDLIPWVESSFRVVSDRNYRALFGQSMGAYGCFRYGILHKDKFKAFAAHAGQLSFDMDLWLLPASQKVMQENPAGPPYTYTYTTTNFTGGTFLLCGAFSPNLNSTQTYINPQIVDFLFDEDGDFIDSVVAKFHQNDILSNYIHQLSVNDDVGIFFGCGNNDDFLLNPVHLAMKDTLDSLGIPYGYYGHNGGHAMPSGFRAQGLIYLDSLLGPPTLGIQGASNQTVNLDLQCFPNPFENTTDLVYTCNTSCEIEISIYDLYGRKVKTLFEGRKAKGKHKIRWNSNDLSPGVYFIHLFTNEGRASQKIIKR
jgi:S-formylglutathione hydrolase FrmB